MCILAFKTLAFEIREEKEFLFVVSSIGKQRVYEKAEDIVLNLQLTIQLAQQHTWREIQVVILPTDVEAHVEHRRCRAHELSLDRQPDKLSQQRQGRVVACSGAEVVDHATGNDDVVQCG